MQLLVLDAALLERRESVLTDGTVRGVGGCSVRGSLVPLPPEIADSPWGLGTALLITAGWLRGVAPGISRWRAEMLQKT